MHRRHSVLGNLKLPDLKESIANTSSTEYFVANDQAGMMKQLMRVSTAKGGGQVQKYVPETALRDFALCVAASEGINQVVRYVMCCATSSMPSAGSHLTVAPTFSVQSHKLETFPLTEKYADRPIK